MGVVYHLPVTCPAASHRLALAAAHHALSRFSPAIRQNAGVHRHGHGKMDGLPLPLFSVDRCWALILPSHLKGVSTRSAGLNVVNFETNPRHQNHPRIQRNDLFGFRGLTVEVRVQDLLDRFSVEAAVQDPFVRLFVQGVYRKEILLAQRSLQQI